MATYKVIQDIEAEDHILGPFSFRQFVYLLIAVFFLYLSFLTLTKNVAFLLILFFPPVLFFGFLSFPFIKDQPTEVWALAKIRFLVKSRKRLWDQSGSKELVIITAPKKIDIALTDNLNQSEVRNRLKALSETIDSRGWAIKNISDPNSSILQENSDRLINPDTLPKNVPDYVVDPQADILDDDNNIIANHMSQMINQSSLDHRQKLMEIMMKSKSVDNKSNEEISNEIKSQKNISQNTTSHLHNISQIETPDNAKSETSINSVPLQKNSTMTPQKNPVILNLSQNDGLNISTISKEANKTIDSNNNEVVISLR